MRKYLNTDILALLPQDLQTSITPVPKRSTAGNKSTNTVSSTDALFLLSMAEINAFTTTTGYKDEGRPYALFSSWPSSSTRDSARIKYYGETGLASDWWLRSSSTTTANGWGCVRFVGEVQDTISLYSSFAICFAFCV